MGAEQSEHQQGDDMYDVKVREAWAVGELWVIRKATPTYGPHYVARRASNTLKLFRPLSGRPPRLLRTAGDY